MLIIKKFLNYTEIKTKITSVFPFVMTLAYLFVSGKQIDPLRSTVFFIGMFLFDLTATTVNNYNDTKKNQQMLAFSRPAALAVTFVLLTLSTALGVWLFALTDIVVLLAGMVCFFFGIIYSWGPVPISHGPYGEAVSGFFYGALIPFIIVYINSPDWLFSYSFTWSKVSISFNIQPLAGLLLLSVLPFCLTANIMLANNTCDTGRDAAVKRYTLPYYLGRSALYLFAFLYYAAYASVIVMVIAGYLPLTSLLLLLTLIPVQKNINAFFKKQVKEETFIVSIKNFIIIISAHIVLIILGSLLTGWGPQ